jgi:hypothetical protein
VIAVVTTQKSQDESSPTYFTTVASTGPARYTDTQRNLDKIVTQNVPYFAHLQHACICGICVCGKCRCNAPKNLSIVLNSGCNCTNYKSNYTGATMQQPNSSFKQQEPLFQPIGNSTNTIYKNDFVKPDAGAFAAFQKDICVPNHTKHSEMSNQDAPNPKKSVYGENYIDFKVGMPHLMFRPSQVPTTDSRLPFIGHASNKEYGRFRSQDIPPLEDGKRFSVSQYKNPINTEVHLPQMGHSHSREAYQPYKQFEPVRLRRPDNEIEMENLPAFQNQFKTSGSNHNGKQNRICPARVILNRMRVSQAN